jgi:hypothetical protein
MKLLGAMVLLTLGLLTGAFAQDAAQGSRAPAPNPAQTPVEREVKGQAGRDIRILVLTNIRPDCTSGPLPTVRLITPPANGKIAVRRVRLNATNVKQCLSLQVPALVAFYRSPADFEGGDTATLEIRPAEGTPQLRRFTISVTKGEPGRSI